MANIKVEYGTSNQTITISVASLTNNSARASTAISNTTNKFIDALVQCQIRTGATGTTATGYINVYAYASVNGGTTYTQSATGTDAAITLTNPPNAILIGSFNTVANATTYVAGPFSVAASFGGALPSNWGIIIQNLSGGTLDATGSNHSVIYQGIYMSST